MIEEACLLITRLVAYDGDVFFCFLDRYRAWRRIDSANRGSFSIQGTVGTRWICIDGDFLSLPSNRAAQPLSVTAITLSHMNGFMISPRVSIPRR